LQENRENLDRRVQLQHVRPSPALDSGDTNARLETDVSSASLLVGQKQDRSRRRASYHIPHID
jgi:hypothetical protein